MRVYVTSANIARRFPGADVGIILSGSYLNAEGWDFVFDNGAYSAYKNGIKWDATAWLRLAKRISKKDRVLWAVVPDVVTDPGATLKSWGKWSGYMKNELGFKLAIAVQDGMIPTDIPTGNITPDIIFVGGSTSWKWRTLRIWTGAFHRVHVGKVNSLKQLTAAYDAGAESVDGSGFTFAPQRKALRQYLNRIKIPRLL